MQLTVKTPPHLSWPATDLSPAKRPLAFHQSELTATHPGLRTIVNRKVEHVCITFEIRKLGNISCIGMNLSLRGRALAFSFNVNHGSHKHVVLIPRKPISLPPSRSRIVDVEEPRRVAEVTNDGLEHTALHGIAKHHVLILARTGSSG